MTDFGPDLFAGTANFYTKYRPAYPAEMFSDIVDKFGLDGQGRLLDLGCGTGELAIPLAKYFSKVLGLDPDRQMLNQAKLKARQAKTANINWQIGSSESLTGVEGEFKLIALGQSFHWMNAVKVLEQMYYLLDTGCGLFIVGSSPVEQDPSAKAKDQAIRLLVSKYLVRRAGPEILYISRVVQIGSRTYFQIPNSVNLKSRFTKQKLFETWIKS